MWVISTKTNPTKNSQQKQLKESDHKMIQPIKITYILENKTNKQLFISKPYALYNSRYYQNKIYQYLIKTNSNI